MNDHKEFRSANVDILGQEKRVVTALGPKDVLYKQRINQTISLTKKGFKTIVIFLALGACIELLFSPSHWNCICTGGEKPYTNIIASHDNSWFKLEESPIVWAEPIPYLWIDEPIPYSWRERSLLEPRPSPKISLPLNWELLRGRIEPIIEKEEEISRVCYAHIPHYFR